MDCNQTQDSIEAYLLGALEQNECEKIEKHLKECSKCKALFDKLAKEFDFLKNISPIEAKGGYAEKIKIKSIRKRLFPLLSIGVFVSLLLFISLIWLLLRYQKEYSYRHLWQIERSVWLYRSQTNVFPQNLGLLLNDKSGIQRLSLNYFKLDQNGNILDRWGTPYIYKLPGKHLQFDLYSCGPNKIDEQGQGDDIANWNIEKK